MIGLILGYLARTVGVVAPLLLPWLVRLPNVPHFDDPKKLGAITSLFVLLCTFVYDAVKLKMPRNALLEFRERFLDKFFKDFPFKKENGFRCNIMFAKRGILWKSFRWVANTGYEPPRHRSLHMWLATFQGAAGQAFKSGEAAFVNIKSELWSSTILRFKYWRNPLNLTGAQIQQLKDVHVALSLPIFQEYGPRVNRRRRIVGVLNIEALSAEAAKQLRTRWRRFVKPLRDWGLLIGALK